MSKTLVTVLAALVMLLGLAGVVLPALPGLALIWLAALGYGLLAGWGASGPWLFGLITLLGLAGLGSELWVTSAGARVAGASGWSVLAGIVLGLIGLLFFSPIGAVIGLTLGILGGEYLRLKDWRKALSAAGGTLAGCGVSYGVKLLLGMVMIGAWVAWVLIG
ncbi:MAG: DUF456 domain-containing protein [Anaerolineales bacterium]|nr:DUF456 domain-containing protein [Anaerolineales bacterium]